MAIHLIIDGYNLIRQTPVLASREQEDLQEGREALLQWLAAYRQQKKHPMTVVFDGWLNGDWQGGRDYYCGIEVLYSRRGEKADEVIKRLVQQEGARAVIVSSDRELQEYGVRWGAAFLSAREFGRRLETVLLGESEEEEAAAESGRRGTRKKGPAHRLPRKLRRNRLRRQKI